MDKRKIIIAGRLRLFILFLILSLLFTGCAGFETVVSGSATQAPAAASPERDPSEVCPVTEPEWAKPPEDAAVQDPPAYGYYYVNEDRSIWASAWWAEQEDTPLRVSEEGVKVGWFRPEGADMEITGERIDGQAPPLEAHASCCYPTRFQASGLYFPTAGCWEVTAKAAGSELTFVVRVEP